MTRRLALGLVRPLRYASVMRQNTDNDLETIEVPRWGRVVPADGPVPWTVVSDDDTEVDAVGQYLGSWSPGAWRFSVGSHAAMRMTFSAVVALVGDGTEVSGTGRPRRT